MAAIVGALRAVLSLDSAAFSKGIKGAQGDMSGLRKSMASIGKGLKVAGAAMTAASTGVALAIKGQLDAADEMSKAAQKFGVPIESLSKLKYAADLSGVAFGTLGTGLQKLSRNMDAAASGNKAAATMFDAIGVSVKNADGSLRKTEAVMGDVADVLSRMPDGAAKTALAMDVFGKSGAELIPMLNGGKTALQQMTDEAASLGLVIDGKTGKAAENFNDNISRVKATLGGLVIQITAALAPALEAMSAKLVEVTKWFRDLSPSTQAIIANLTLVAMAAGPVVLAMGFVVSSMGAVMGASVALIASLFTLRGALLATGFGALVVGAGLLVAKFAELADRAGGFGNALGLLSDVAIEVWDRIRRGASLMAEAIAGSAMHINAAFANAFAGVVGSFADMTSAIASGWNGLMGMMGIQSNAQGMGVEMASKMRAEADMLANNAQAFGASISESFKDISAPLASITALRDAVADGADTAAESLNSAAVAADGLGDTLEDVGGKGGSGGGNGGRGGEALDALKEKADALKAKIEEVRSTMSGAFVGLVTGAKSLKSAIGEILNKFAEMLASSAFDMLWSGGKGGGLGGLVSKLFGFADGGVFSGGKVQAFAKGGVVAGATAFAMQGGLGVMGEAGPEAIMPLTRGPDGKLGVQASAEGPRRLEVVVTMDPSTGALGAYVQDQAERVVARAGPVIAGAAVERVVAMGREDRIF